MKWGDAEIYVAAYLAKSASLTKAGHVQLSNATNSTSNTFAATPSAVKKAYDLAQQAKMDGNSRKLELVDALLLLDPSLPITKSSTWQEIILVTSQVSTGKKPAQGFMTGYGGKLTVRGLDFAPSTVISWGGREGNVNQPSGEFSFLSTELGMNLSIQNGYLRRYDLYNDGFSIDGGNLVSWEAKWIAFGI